MWYAVDRRKPVHRRIFLAVLALTAAPAAASVSVIGNSSARLCYEAAESESAAGILSISECDKALTGENELAPHDIVATYVNRGILQLRRGRADAALTDFDAAIARDPREPEAYLNKAAALMRDPADPATAVTLFTAALDNKTSKPALAYYGRGLAHELLGDVKSAYFDYKLASEADPKWPKPQQELARFSVKRN